MSKDDISALPNEVHRLPKYSRYAVFPCTTAREEGTSVRAGSSVRWLQKFMNYAVGQSNALRHRLQGKCARSRRRLFSAFRACCAPTADCCCCVPSAEQKSKKMKREGFPTCEVLTYIYSSNSGHHGEALRALAYPNLSLGPCCRMLQLWPDKSANLVPYNSRSSVP